MDENTNNPPPYTDKDLYGPSGAPMPSDLEQHKLGDCYFISPLGSLAHQQPQRIEQGISYNAQQQEFTVTLYQETHTGFLGLHDTAKPVQVVVTQADLQTDLNVGGDSLRNHQPVPDLKGPLWPAVYEAAYAKMAELPKENLDQGFQRIGGGAGGQPSDAMYALTGSRTHTLFPKDLDKLGLDASYTQLDTALKEGRPILLSTMPMKDTPSDGLIKGDWDKQTGHAYMLEGVSKSPSGDVMVTVRNPWGTNQFPTQGVDSPDPTVTVNLKEILKNGHLEDIQIGPKAESQKLDQKQSQATPDVKTGSPGLDKVLASMNDPAAFKQAIVDLQNSPTGQAFHAQGRAQVAEMQNQQLQTQVAQQATQQAPQQAQAGPVMTR
jgi:hypothetical protein